MLSLFGGQKKKRPYLKVCKRCHGKGQLSSFNTSQQKKYGACDTCTSSSDITGLGVTLKCACLEKSAPYTFVRATDLKFIRGLDRDEVQGLQGLQARLSPSGGTAVLLQCDCGARYLVADEGKRVRISGQQSANSADKGHNKEIAQALVDNGISIVLRPPKVVASAQQVVPT